MYVFYKEHMSSSGSLIKHFILISVKITQRKSKFRYDSAKLKSQFKNRMHD